MDKRHLNFNKTPIPEAKRKRIKRLLEEGYQQKEVAEMTGVSKTAVHKIASEKKEVATKKNVSENPLRFASATAKDILHNWGRDCSN